MKRQEEGEIVCICGIHDMELYRFRMGLSFHPTFHTHVILVGKVNQSGKNDFRTWQQFRNIDTDITVNYIVLSNRKLPSLGLLVPLKERRDFIGVG